MRCQCLLFYCVKFPQIISILECGQLNFTHMTYVFPHLTQTWIQKRSALKVSVNQINQLLVFWISFWHCFSRLHQKIMNKQCVKKWEISDDKLSRTIHTNRQVLIQKFLNSFFFLKKQELIVQVIECARVVIHIFFLATCNSYVFTLW